MAGDPILVYGTGLPPGEYDVDGFSTGAGDEAWFSIAGRREAEPVQVSTSADPAPAQSGCALHDPPCAVFPDRSWPEETT